MKATIIKFPKAFEGPDKPLAEYELGERMEVLIEVEKTKDGYKVCSVEGMPYDEEKEYEEEKTGDEPMPSMGEIAVAAMQPPSA